MIFFLIALLGNYDRFNSLRALALENANAILFYNSKNLLYHYNKGHDVWVMTCAKKRKKGNEDINFFFLKVGFYFKIKK